MPVFRLESGTTGGPSGRNRLRKYRELYLTAEDEIPFQAVADAIDIARSNPGSPPAMVYLFTPQVATESVKCIPPI
jgi:hypothetical protein